MFVDFQTLPATARIWVYYIPRTLSAHEKEAVSHRLTAFCEGWAAHQVPLKTSFQFMYEQFIVLAVDEEYHGASGCSIDSSVKVIRELAELLQVDLFNRQYAAYWEGAHLHTLPLSNLKALALPADTLVCDTLATTLGDLRQKERIPAQATWLKRYFQPLTTQVEVV